MDKVLVRTLDVMGICTPEIEDLRLVEDGVVKAQDLFVLAIHGIGSRRHFAKAFCAGQAAEV